MGQSPNGFSVDEPIAIVGIGCRFPGGVDGPEKFWTLLLDEVDAVGEVPTSRFTLDAVYDPRPQTPGRISTRYGAFLEDIDRFDAEFFGITPLEARSVDPQQRLLLEVAWEAFEDAGLVLERIPRQRTGVYVGMMASDYEDRLQSDTGSLNAFALNGSGRYGASGRLSFALGLHGPSMTIDTACSSSLVSVHLACQSLRRRETDLALAGGAHVLLQPHVSISLCQANILSRDGRCKFGDARADGFVRGEGAGLVVLKRLADAIADGDRIHALILGSAVNNDGNASRTMGRPSRDVQEQMLREAYRAAGVRPEDVDYVEAHGTGTSAGDPAELGALGAVLGRPRSPGRVLLLGSVKTNLGHTEGASGIAGLIKLALSLEQGYIPRSLHFEHPSPAVAWEDLRLVVQSRGMRWPTTSAPRRGGINSFGMSGTNAHAVLEQPASVQTRRRGLFERSRHILPLSAKSPLALREAAARYASHLERHPELGLEDICHTAAVGRAHFEHRIAVTAASRDEARERLTALAHAEESSPAASTPGSRKPKVAFLFTGQGSQYVGMGRVFYATQPVFRAAIDRCAELLAPWQSVPLLPLLYPAGEEDTAIHQTAQTQPALFALEFALAELWRSWGVEPAAVLGHSIGEYAAACVAGVLSLGDALRLVAERGRRMQALPPGAMASVQAPESVVGKALASAGGRVSIAAVNGPGQVVVSGDPACVDAICRSLRAQGIETKRLEVSHAFHSAMMDPILDDFERVVGEAALSRPRIPVASNVTGAIADEELASASYWRRHVREPVRFADGIRSLRELGVDAFVEIGPQPVLVAMGAACAPERGALWLPSLRKGRDDWEVALPSLARLYERGAHVDWTGFDAPYPRRRVRVPTYPWQRKRHWAETASVLSSTPADRQASEHAVPEDLRESATIAVARRAQPVEGAESPAIVLQPVRELLRFPPDTPPTETLESLGVDSLGIAVVRSALVRLPGGKDVARRLSGASPLSEVLPFLALDTGESGKPAPTIADHVRDAQWQPVTPSSVNKRSADNVLLARCARLSSAAGPSTLGELRMHPAHPFFYERPLDHVPGMYLIEAVRQLFNWRLHSLDGNLEPNGTLDRVEADFFHFVEHDQPAYIVLTPATQSFAADLFQAGKRKAAFSLAARRMGAAEYQRLRSRQRQAG